MQRERPKKKSSKQRQKQQQQQQLPEIINAYDLLLLERQHRRKKGTQL